MNMKLGPGEPLAGPWRVTPIRDLVRLLFGADRARDGRPWILAVDGRSGSGKSTVAALLHRSVPASAIVHTDDVTWHHSFLRQLCTNPHFSQRGVAATKASCSSSCA